jgi:putative protease
MAEEKKEELVGKITHYFGKIEVGIIEISKGKLAVGDKIHVKGTSTDFEQTVDSMQIEHEQVEKAKKGDAIGLKVKDKVREGDEVYKVIE